MASLSKHHSSGKPKLERRNARKISDYEPSDSPSPRIEGPPPSFRTLDKGSSKSFRVVGLDSQREIERICRELGLAGGADAFSIPQDAWDAGRARSNSFDRFLEPQPRSKSFDEPAGSGFGRHGSEFARSPLAGTGSLSPRPFYNSMTSSSGDSVASDSSFVTGEKGFFGSLETPTESGPVTSETRQYDDHQQPGNAIQHARGYGTHETQSLDYRKQSGNVAREPSIRGTQHLDDGETRAGTVLPVRPDQGSHDTQLLADRKGTPSVTHNGSTHETRAHDSRQIGNEMERVPRLIVEKNPQILLPPPGMRSKSYLPDLSTHELLKSFGPDENVHENPASDRDDTTSSDSEDSEADVVDDEAKEEFEGFVSNAVQQNGVPAEEETSGEDTWSPTPTTPGRSPNLIRIQSWRKLEMLGSGSFGTVYEGMSEDGVYFAVKEVSLSESDSRAQQCVTQLEQEIEFLSKFRHENIVQYLGTQKEPDKLYIFLELVTKGSLYSLYQKYTLFESQIRSYTRQILSGLMYLHERKVMHRDIKCANILVDVTGKIKVADFGLAKQISQLDEAKSCKGSAYWMAPEVINPRKTYSFPADIWSLGCTVLEMETRRPPFADMEWSRVLWKVGHGEAPPIPDDLSEDAKDFIKRCLEVNPAKRPTARKLLEHPFVRYAGSGLTPRNSFTEDLSAELPVIAEDKTL